MDPIKILVPVGSLGAGVRDVELDYGLSRGAHAIATDAGSTDSGAAYLATGTSKNSRGSVKRDLTKLIRAAAEGRIPLLIGTAGQAGGVDDGSESSECGEQARDRLERVAASFENREAPGHRLAFVGAAEIGALVFALRGLELGAVLVDREPESGDFDRREVVLDLEAFDQQRLQHL